MIQNPSAQYKIFISLILIASSLRVSAQFSPSDEYPLIIQYSAFDYPFQQFGMQIEDGAFYQKNQDREADYKKTWSIQSPEQATQVTNNIMNSVHWGIGKIPMFTYDDNLNFAARALLTGAYDVLSTKLPFHSAWLHAEGHRAVMATAFTYSYNPYGLMRYDDPKGDGRQMVNRVLDTNLSVMKTNYNANFVRASTMGGEMGVYAALKMQQSAFFNGPQNGGYTEVRPLHSVYYFMSFLNLTRNLATCSNQSKTAEIAQKQMVLETDKQRLRDFTGLDYTTWAYDLHNPNVYYADRGKNPNGNGYDRYIYGDKLTQEQYTWIKKQSRLSLLNFFSPTLLFIDKLWVNDNVVFNFSGRYYPTSFGNQVGMEFYIQTANFNLFLAPHLNQNKTNSFMGIEAMIYEKPMKIWKIRFLTTGRLVLDGQPKSQSFTETLPEFTGLAGMQIAFKIGDYIYPFLAAEYKSRGWIAGNPFLYEQASAKVGLSVRFNYEYAGK